MTRPIPFFPSPEPGDILWCRFPEVEGIRPGPKPRPCIVTWVSDPPEEKGHPFRVRVVYGTSAFSGLPGPTEIDITPDDHPAAYLHAGLSKPTRFDLARAVVVNYDDMFFALAPNAGRIAEPTPRLGTLHASRYRALREAGDAVVARGRRKAP